MATTSTDSKCRIFSAFIKGVDARLVDVLFLELYFKLLNISLVCCSRFCCLLKIQQLDTIGKQESYRYVGFYIWSLTKKDFITDFSCRILLYSLICLISSNYKWHMPSSVLYSAIIMICLNVTERMQRLHLVTSSLGRYADVPSILNLCVY